MNSTCSVVVMSCDKYEEAWYPFFELLHQKWPTCDCNLYLNTEKKHFFHPELNITVLNCLENEITPWGKRAVDCLKRIDTPYVILLLEDFFLQREVDFKEINHCLEMMENNPKMSAIYFKRITGFTDDYDEKYYILTENKRFKLNLQAGLWRTADLVNFILPQDTPWSFEEDFMRLEGGDKVFLCSKAGGHADIEGCVFPYYTERSLGYGIWAGKWLWNNKKLFSKNQIKVKYKKLAYYPLWKYKLSKIHQKWKGMRKK